MIEYFIMYRLPGADRMICLDASGIDDAFRIANKLFNDRTADLIYIFVNDEDDPEGPKALTARFAGKVN